MQCLGMTQMPCRLVASEVGRPLLDKGAHALLRSGAAKAAPKLATSAASPAAWSPVKVCPIRFLAARTAAGLFLAMSRPSLSRLA